MSIGTFISTLADNQAVVPGVAVADLHRSHSTLRCALNEVRDSRREIERLGEVTDHYSFLSESAALSASVDLLCVAVRRPTEKIVHSVGMDRTVLRPSEELLTGTEQNGLATGSANLAAYDADSAAWDAWVTLIIDQMQERLANLEQILPVAQQDITLAADLLSNTSA